MFETVRASADEVVAARPGDDLVPDADVVMDRAFTIDRAPDAVWPWLLQLGKRRAGWYLPRSVERVIPRTRRASRVIEQVWQRLDVGDVIPDYGGRNETFEAAIVHAPTTLVYRSRRGRTGVSWSITLTARSGAPADAPTRTRVHLRLRLGPVRRRWLVGTVGDLIDLLTIAGLAAGLRERLQPPAG